MDYSLNIKAVLTWIEAHIAEKTNIDSLSCSVGFTSRYLGEVFKKATGVSIARYVAARKIANTAFEISISDKHLTEIAYKYGFESYDTFRRMFKRETGMTPSEFRSGSYICGRKHICMGMFAPAIPLSEYPDVLPLKFTEVAAMNNQKRTDDSMVLYGIPKVYYGNIQDGTKQFTPFPICLQAVLNYMGQPVHYSQLMAASGASFRLRWNPEGWDMAAVDIRNTFYERNRPFEQTLRAVGRRYKTLYK